MFSSIRAPVHVLWLVPRGEKLNTVLQYENRIFAWVLDPAARDQSVSGVRGRLGLRLVIAQIDAEQRQTIKSRGSIEKWRL